MNGIEDAALAVLIVCGFDPAARWIRGPCAEHEQHHREEERCANHLPDRHDGSLHYLKTAVKRR